MALTEAEELELLELEEAEAQEQGQSAQGDQTTQPVTGLDKAVQISNQVTDVASLPFRPVGAAIGAVKRGSDTLADKLAESGHPFLAMHAAGPSTLIEGAGKGIELLNKAGEKTAEFAGRKGFPKTGAAIGTGISMIPDIAAGAGAIAKRELIAQGLKGAAKTALSPAKFAKDLVTRPAASEVSLAGKESLAALEEGGKKSLKEVAERGAEKLNLARETKDAAKKGLIEAEEKAGLHFESTPGFEAMLTNKKKMAQFSQKLSRLAKRTPEELAQSIPSEQLQLFRKLAQEGEKVSGLSDIANSQLRHGKDVFTRALGIKEKGVGEALSRFREAEKVTGEIPSEIKGRLTKQKLANQKNLSEHKLKTEREILDAKSFERKRKFIKSLAKGALYYAGARSIFH